MATLTRPGVEITQEFTAEAATVLTPTLIPCIVGPCFQIVEPLTSAGSLNSSATVSTAARILASAAVADPIPAISGTAMTIVVNGVDKPITFPTSVGGAAISQSAIAQTINTALGSANATARFVDNVLEILTVAKGTGASISVKSSPSTAHAALNLTTNAGITHTGRGAYDNRTYAVPYTSFPSPLVSDMSELVLEGENIALYRYFSGRLTEFATDSAPNWNSYVGGATSVGGSARTIADQPSLANPRTSLHGVKSSGSKTNKLMHLGREATITIPLAHATGGGAIVWPDPSGAGFLKVTALGYQNYKISPTNAIGDFVGAAGNAISVVFNNLGAKTAVWDGVNTLTISHSATMTYAELEAALATVTNASSQLVIELGIPTGLDASPITGTVTTPWGAATRTFMLSGGIDPIDFSATIAGAARQAWVTGAVHLDTTTAAVLGVTGHTLGISVDGGEWIDVTFDGASAPATQINTALAAAGVGAAASVASVVNEDGVAFSPMKINGLSTDGHDSTIEIRADNPVTIQKLFSGVSTSTDAISNVKHTNSWGGAGVDTRKVVLTSGPSAKYNLQATAFQELAVVPGSLTLDFQGIGLAGHMVFDLDATTHAALITAALGQSLVLIHDPAGAADTDTFNIGAGPFATLADLATDINSSLVNTAGKISVGVIGANLVFGDATGIASFQIGAASHATVKAMLNAGGNAFDAVTVSSAATSMTIQDTGTNNALQVTATGNSVSNALHGAAFAAAFDPTDAADLTALFLDAAAGFTYSNGTSPATSVAAGCVVFAGGIDAAVAAKDPLTAVILAGTDVQVTYTRMWPCATGAVSPSYTGRVFHGHSQAMFPGDKLWNNGSVVGVINSIGTLSLGGSFPGALLTISEFAVDNSTDLDKWYVTAQNLSPGSGRVEPEMATDDVVGIATVKHALLRNASGIALPGSATVYAQYSALRQDVSAASADPQLLTFASSSEVAAVLGASVPANPLSYALSKAFEATSVISISALGVSAVSADAPGGTPEAYTEALDYLERKEVYALAPLTHDPAVHRMFDAHVTAMSLPANKKERISLVCAALPTEKVATLALSGTASIASIGGDKYELTFADSGLNAITALDGLLDANGNTLVVGAGTTLTPTQGVYIDRAGDAYRYLVTKVVSASVVQIEVGAIFSPDSGPGTGGNGDAYFATEASLPGALDDFSAAGEACSLLVRQAAISKATTSGRNLIVDTMADITGGTSGYQNRRLVWMQPEAYSASVGGTTTRVPGYHYCASLAAMIGELSPSQPYTNLPVAGYTAPLGSSDLFSETQMATAAAGGVWWNIQDTPGGAVFSRHQLTTDTATLKTRELSIVVAVDYVAKLLRNQVQRYVGRNNITKALLTSISIGVSGALSGVSGSIVASASLTSISQSATSPDTVVLVVSITPFYPANTISITIYV